MKRAVLMLLILGGCTSNHYSPADAGMNDALDMCKHDVIHASLANTDHLGALIGGGLGGPIGGAIGGVVEGKSQTNAPKMDLNNSIENCMKNKGYVGISSGYN